MPIIEIIYYYYYNKDSFVAFNFMVIIWNKWIADAKYEQLVNNENFY